jgi:hypothetical protein
MAVNGGKTPHWAAKPATKAKPTKVRKKAKAKKPKKPTQMRSHGDILTTSLGMATALTPKWRKWSCAEKRIRYLKALDMNAEAAEARPALQEEVDLLPPAYIRYTKCPKTHQQPKTINNPKIHAYFLFCGATVGCGVLPRIYAAFNFQKKNCAPRSMSM